MIYTQAYQDHQHYTTYNSPYRVPKHYTKYVIYVVSFILFNNSIMLAITFSTLQIRKLRLRETAQSHTSEGVRESQDSQPGQCSSKAHETQVNQNPAGDPF